MNTARSIPADNAPTEVILNGLNHSAVGRTLWATWPAYTLTSATMAKTKRMTISAPRSSTWVKADSSMPM